MTTLLPGEPEATALPPDVPGQEETIRALRYDRDRFEARDRARSTWTVFAVVFAGMALVASTVAWGFSQAKTPQGGGTAVVGRAVGVSLSEFKIAPQMITAKVGDTLKITNTGAVAHQLSVQGTPLATPILAGGQSAALDTGRLAPGSYVVFCNVPGHQASGMEAALNLTAGATDTSSAAGSPGPMAPSGMASGAGSAPAGITPEMRAAGMTMTPQAMEQAMKDSTVAFPAKTTGVGAEPLSPTVLPDGTKQFDLTAQIVDWQTAPGKTVKAWTYNGTVPGPTMRVNPGDKISVVLHNRLPEATTIHFHGITGPQVIDGVPYVSQDPVEPGADFTYAWTASMTPEIGMYHSHFDAVTQVPDGMAGALLVGEMPMPAQAVSQGANASLRDQVMFLNDSGTIGLSLNGKSFPATAPFVAKQGQWLEVTYFNEGEMIHPMHLHQIPQIIIARDGFSLSSPEMDDTVLVAPGQRITVLIHATDVGTWVWHCHILSHAEGSSGMLGMVTALVVKAA